MTLTLAPTFGSGGAEPYANALRGVAPQLYLRDASTARTADRPLDVAGWTASADAVDRSLVARLTGPVLDIGSGPGRLVRASMARGLTSLGIDVSAAAIETARRLGGTFSHQSVFDRVPGEGLWRTALLIDGNIGIGGDIPALLRRCAELISADGAVVAELHSNPAHEQRFDAEVVDESGAASERFPWAEVGLDGLRRMLDATPFTLVKHWNIGGRTFCRLALR